MNDSRTDLVKATYLHISRDLKRMEIAQIHQGTILNIDASETADTMMY